MESSTDAMMRIVAQYREMPGLCLTPAQIERLFGVEPRMADAVLRTLVDQGMLTVTSSGHYVLTSAA